MTSVQNSTYMQLAIEEARKAARRGEVPVGAVLVDAGSDKVLAIAANRTEEDSDPAGHAEIQVLRQGGKIKGTPRLADCDLYVTLEPCPMCAAAISQARIRRVYYGAYDPKSGGIDHGPRLYTHAACHHKPEVYGGIDEQVCAGLMTDFFKERRS